MMTYRSNSAAQLIGDCLTMRQVMETYGYEPNRMGYIFCPFHNEKTASLKVYNKSFYCFGCNTGGDMIDFVKKLFHLNFPQALVRIGTDFSLPISSEKADRRQIEQIRRKRYQETLEREKRRAEYEAKTLEHRALWLCLERNKPTSLEQGEKSAQFIGRLEDLDYWFDTHPYR